MSVKKQDLPAYDPRGIQGMGLQYATSEPWRLSCSWLPDFSRNPGLHRKNWIVLISLAKEVWIEMFKDLTAVIDSTGLCLFTSFALGAQQYADMLNEVLGTTWSAEEVLLADRPDLESGKTL